MDTLKRITEKILKHKYAVLVLVLGLVLMLLPTSKKETETPAQEESTVAQEQDISLQLTEILGQIEGVGQVRVMLTVAAGESTVYRYDEDGDTVIITDADRAESGLVEQVIPASYLGAIIVCQGADSAAVRLNVIEAVSKVTGLSTDRISVLKMK